LIVADVLIDQIKDIICLTPSPEWYQLIKDYHKQLPLLSSMAKASTHDLKNLCKSLNIYYSFFKGSYKIHDLLFLNTSEEWMKIETEIFMTMLNYRVGNIQEAHNFINNYITDRKDIFTNLDGAKGRNMEALYLSCTKDYLKHKSLNKTEEQTFLSLATNFGKKLAEEICCDFEKPENIFQSYDLPSHLIEIGPQSNVKEILFFLNKLIKIESYENMPC